MTVIRDPLPPFTFETAFEKVRKAESAWNTRDPALVALAYSPDSISRPWDYDVWWAVRPSSLS